MADKETIEIILKTTFDKALADYKKINQQVDQHEKKQKRLNTVLKNAKTNWIGLTAALGGTFLAAKKVLAAAGEQEKQEKLLAAAMRNSGKFTEERFNHLKTYASELQKVTAFGDEEILVVQKTLTQYGLEKEALDEVTKATLDFASAKGIDLKTASDLVGKTVGSTTNALSRYGATTIVAQEKTERARQTVEALSKLFGGSAQAEANTYTGQVKQAGNALGDTAEIIGAALIPAVLTVSQTLRDAAVWFNEIDKSVRDTIVTVGLFVAGVIVLTKVVSVFGVAFSSAFLPVTAITAAIVGLIWVINNWEIALQAIKVAFIWLGTEAVKYINNLTSPFVNMINTMIKGSNRLLGTQIKNIELISQETLKSNEELLNMEIDKLDKMQEARDGADEIEIENNQIKNDAIDASDQVLQDKKKHRLEDYLSVTQKITSQLQGIYSQYYKNQSIQLQNDYNKKLGILNSLNTSDEERAKLKEALDAQYELQRQALARKQAKHQKALAFVQALISTAQAVTMTLGSLPFPANVIAAAGVQTLGAIQAELIRRQPIPEAEEGALIRGTAAGSIIRAGEKGKSEAIIPLENEEAMDKLGGVGGNVTIVFQSDTMIADEELPERIIDQIDKGLYDLGRDGLSRSFA